MARPDAAQVRRGAALARSLQTLVDALAPGSPFRHHALRTAAAVGIASLLAARLSPVRSYWVTLTTLAVMQPYPGATMKRAGERVLGTVFGSVLAIAIVEWIRSPLALSALLVPLSIAAVATRPRSYRLFTFFLTPVFVLLAGRSGGDFSTAALRAGDAVLGGAVALVVGVLVVPASEARRLPDLLGPMLDALHAYARATLRSSSERAAPNFGEYVARARRACGVALGATETSLERFLAEPLRDREAAAFWVLLVTYARRLAASMTALDALAVPPLPPDFDRTVAEVAVYLEHTLCPAPNPGAPAGQGSLPFSSPISSWSPPDVKGDSPVERALDRIVRWAALMRALGSEGPRDDAPDEALSQNEGSRARSRTSLGQQPTGLR